MCRRIAQQEGEDHPSNPFIDLVDIDNIEENKEGKSPYLPN